MGARPSSFKKGGGFLNNVDGVITGYEFTDDTITKDGREPFKPGKVKGTDGKLKDRFHSLNFILSVRPDGADEDVTTTLFAGGADDFKISDDGQEVWDANYETPEEAADAGDEARQLGAGTALFTLIDSLVEAGFPAANLNETRIEYSSIIGTRCRFVQRKNEEATKRLGKRKDKKTGKLFDRQDLVIDQVYSLPEATDEAPAPAKKTTAKPAVKTTTAKVAPKTPAKKSAEPEADIEQETKTALIEILSSLKGNKIEKPKLSMKVIQTRTKHPQREAIRTLMLDNGFLSQEDGWSFDAKTGVVSLAEVEETVEA